MAKKLIRTYAPSASQLEKVTDRDIDIILKTKSVYFGTIKQIKNDTVIFRDKINNKIVIPIDDIAEIIIDELHSFS